MKKTLAIILALALVFSSFTFAFAEEVVVLPADAAAVTGLGMLVGAGNGVTLDYLKIAPTRIQAAIMVLRLKGLEATAKAFVGTDNFADANTATWATPIMAYLKANPTLGWIGDGTNFNPNGPMDAKSYYKVMLETLGYKQNTNEVIGEFTFDKTFEFAATVGLTKNAAVLSFTVNDLATATIEALKANVKGTEKTLTASLVDAKVITEAQAVAAGVYSPVPVVLAVDSVTTDNLKQLTVKFNKEIKAAGDEGNYELTADDDSEILLDEDSDFALQADNKTVVITLTADAAQQEVVELTVKDIEAVDGSKLTETVVENIELFDKTIPAALKAEVVGIDVIKVTFSEPMDALETNEDDFEVDGGEIIIEKVELVNNNTEANVYLFSELEDGKLEVEVGTGATDYAGYSAPRKSFDLIVVEDTTAPVVVGFEDADLTSVTLIFNEDIKVKDGDIANFYHTNDSNVADAGDGEDDLAGEISLTAVDGNKLTLKFVGSELPEGKAYIYIVKDAISDLWNNENAKVSYAVDVTVDVLKPTVTSLEGGDTEEELVITFSETMDEDTAEEVENYTILDKDGKEVEDVIVSADIDDDVVTITFDDEMSGDYSIVIEGLDDKAGNTIVKVTKTFDISDVTPPNFASDFSYKLYAPGTADQMLKVSFGEEMSVEGKYSVVDLDKYVFVDVNDDAINLSKVEDATIKAVDGNKAVEIELPYDAADPADDTYAFSGGDQLDIARVADAADNTTPQLVCADIAYVGGIEVTVETVEQTAADTIVVTLEDRLTKFYSSDFTIYASANTDFIPAEEVEVARIRHTINEDGMSVVTFTLEADINTDGTKDTFATGDLVYVDIIPSASASVNKYGEELETNHFALEDDAAPVLVVAEFVDEDTIVLTFSEVILNGTFLNGSKNGFSVSGGELDYATHGNDSYQITLVAEDGEEFTEDTNVFYSSVFGLSDGEDNEIANFSHTDELEQ